VLTGAGTTFCSGFDLSTRAQGLDFVEHAHRLFACVVSYPAPVIAALNGPAVGMGCVLAAHSDLRVGCEGSWLEIPAARLGVTLGEEYVAMVTHRLGLATAQLLFVGSRRVEARRAAELGAIHALAEDPANVASLWAAQAASLAPTSLAAHKAFVNRAHSP
jgi:enoyl-CoA hydratase